MIISGFRGSNPSDITEIADTIKTYDLGGVILFDENICENPPTSHNIRSPKQVKWLTETLQKASRVPLLIMTDQEGGQVNRFKPQYGFPETESWNTIGSFLDKNKTKYYSDKIATSLSDAGININLAPVIDLPVSPDSFLNTSKRCFHQNPEETAYHARIFIDCHEKKGVMCTLKHFPGIGSAKSDTHKGFTDITRTWSPVELEPFKEIIEGGDVDLIMVGHVYHSGLDSDWPASLSEKIVKGLLRDQLGYEGVIISDDPAMLAIAEKYSLDIILEKMINASIDLFCFGNNLTYDPDIVPKVVSTLKTLKAQNRISSIQIDEALMRIQQLKSKLT